MTSYDLRAATLLELGAATLGETGGFPLPPRIRGAYTGVRLVGLAYPVRCTPGDNLAIHAAVAAAPERSALVVDVGDERDFGYWGEILTVAAQSRDLAGLVIDGGVRDVARIEHLRFPAFSTTIAFRGTSKTQPGTIGVPVTIGGVEISPGDWVIGDADGVTIVPGVHTDEITDVGKAHVEKEDMVLAQLRAGQTTIELLGIDDGPITKG